MAEVIARLRAGDRSAAGEFIQRYGPMVRRRVRGKLGTSMRRLFDSQDILSTVSRRLDRYVASGRIRAATEGELWRLVLRIVDAALVDKIRLIKRLKRGVDSGGERDDSELARLLLRRLETSDTTPDDDAELLLDRAFGSLEAPADRQMLSLWLRGHRHTAIAATLGISPDAARQRWVAIRARLRRTLGSDAERRDPGGGAA
ncbi:MAG: RNA polymerase sigma factor [Phycisphaerales bacterium]